MKRYFIQHDSSPEPVNCLRVCAPWHREYAKLHNFEYIEDYSKVDAAPYSANSEGQMWFFRLMKDLEEDAEVYYGDADILQAKLDHDMFSIMPEDREIMMLGGKHTWVNSGVVLMRNTKNLRDWFDYLIQAGPVSYNNKFIDHRFIKEFDSGRCWAKFAFFDDRFNWFPTYGGAKRNCYWVEKYAVVKAWHGYGGLPRVQMMKDELEKLQRKYKVAA